MNALSIEKNLVALACLGVAAFMGGSVLSKTESQYDDIAKFQARSAFSYQSFILPEVNPELAIDGDVSTVWKETWFTNPGGNCSAAKPEPDVGPLCTFIQIDLGFSHSPGKPHIPNPLDSLEIVLPPLAAGSFARPQNVDLVFFTQEIVDMDRQFRLPPLPDFLLKKRVHLQNAERSEISLKDLPQVVPSADYPGIVRRMWVRIEFKDVYPGSENKIAISEIRYRNQRQQ